MSDSFEKACKYLLGLHESVDLVMVIDKLANIVTNATRDNQTSSVRSMSYEDIVRTAMRVNIAKGAFNADKDKTGSSSIHAQYNAMDMIIYTLDKDFTLIVIGFIEPLVMSEVLNSISKVFPTKTKRAIVVDDESDITSAIRDVLEKRGFEVTVCNNGLACIHSIEKARNEMKEYGIVVLDIRMPDMDGFQVFKEIQTISPNTNVLFITAFEYTKADILNKTSSPKAKLLRKPFTRADLLQSINEASTN